MVSAEHPYGALVVPVLADAAQVVHSEPKYYFVPDDPALGFTGKHLQIKFAFLNCLNPLPMKAITKARQKWLIKLLRTVKIMWTSRAVLRARLA